MLNVHIYLGSVRNNNIKEELHAAQMNLWSNYTLVPTVVDLALKFVFMIIK